MDALRSTIVSFGQNCVPEIENTKIRLYPGIDCQLVACRQHVVATHGDEAILGSIKTEGLPNLACRKRCPPGMTTTVSISYVIKVHIPGPPADETRRGLNAGLRPGTAAQEAGDGK